MSPIEYTIEPLLSVDEFIDVLVRSTLHVRRPVADTDRIASMLAHASLLATARNQEGLLVGVARALTDFSYCTYLSDLAVDLQFQRKGIGSQLLELVRERAGPNTKLVLLAAPASVDFYERVGMVRHNGCFMLAEELC